MPRLKAAELPPLNFTINVELYNKIASKTIRMLLSSYFCMCVGINFCAVSSSVEGNQLLNKSKSIDLNNNESQKYNQKQKALFCLLYFHFEEVMNQVHRGSN